MNNGYAVMVEDVSKQYQTGSDEGVVALDQVTLTIEADRMVALMGPSGSGKSTLLHIIGAMDAADQGSIRVGEHEVTALSGARQVAYRRTIGFVFQRFHLLPALTVQDNIAAPTLPYRVTYDRHERAHQLAAAVGLTGRETALPSHLSGGQQQRVAIARALINQPGLLLADEPTGNLDSQTGSEILDLLHQLRQTHGMTVIIATHDPTVAAAADTVIHLKDGHIVSPEPQTSG
jgi:putative ABC transport system ATP-binding protein